MFEKYSTTMAAEMHDLARRVAKGRVDGPGLDAYMRRLLERDRVELCAACRAEAARLSLVSTGLSPRALAKASQHGH